jgi:hypothetical protein
MMPKLHAIVSSNVGQKDQRKKKTLDQLTIDMPLKPGGEDGGAVGGIIS